MVQICEIADITEGGFVSRSRLIIGSIPINRPSQQLQKRYVRDLLEHLLTITFTGKSPGWKFAHRPSGAPYIAAGPKGKPFPRLSLSHKSNWVAAGISSGAAIGIDIEQVKAGRNTRQLMEFLGWETQAAGESDFYQRWTLWEAYTKCRQGRLLEPSSQEFEALCACSGYQEGSNPKTWHGFHIVVSSGVHCALVVRTHKPVRLAWRHLDGKRVPLW